MSLKWDWWEGRVWTLGSHSSLYLRLRQFFSWRYLMEDKHVSFMMTRDFPALWLDVASFQKRVTHSGLISGPQVDLEKLEILDLYFRPWSLGSEIARKHPWCCLNPPQCNTNSEQCFVLDSRKWFKGQTSTRTRKRTVHFSCTKCGRCCAVI